MSRFHVYLLIAMLFALPVAAQQPQLPNSCGLRMSLLCSDSGTCTSTTTNGPATCAGTVYAGIWLIGSASATGNVSPLTTTLNLPECFDSTTSPIPNLSNKFAVCLGPASLGPGASFNATASVTGVVPANRSQIVAITFIVDDQGNQSYAAATPGSGDPCTPVIHVPVAPTVNTDYTIHWDPIPNAPPGLQYTITETDAATSTQVSQFTGAFTSQKYNHDKPAKYTYTVTPQSCPTGGTPGTASLTIDVVAKPAPAPAGTRAEGSAPFGSTAPVGIDVALPGTTDNVTFNATTDKQYLTVSPSSGTIGPNGTTVTVTASPGSLPAGTNTGTLSVAETNTNTGKSSTSNTPVSINLVTPVQPSPNDLPPPNTLVIPIVTHVNAAAGPFTSDVRLTNATGQPANYLVSIAPADPKQQAEATTITVPAQSTAALNDIVKNFFGFGATGAATDVGFGSLQIRPLDAAASLSFAASRTYTTQAIGTFGQFIAATPFAKFATQIAPPTIPGAGAPPTTSTRKLSLQQVSHIYPGGRFRTNYGIAEGAGQPATGVVRLFDDNGNVVASTPFSLNPNQIEQLSLSSISGFPANGLTDGRIEVEITSQTGAVTAYASVLDNGTTDPYGVAPVDVSQVSSTRYVLPGIAEINNPKSNYHSDARIFNGGTSDVTATLSFFPFTGFPGADAKTLTIPAGHVAALDNILPNFFGVSGTGGSVVVTTPAASSLVTTANTYSNSPGGTFGQFIPGVTSTGGTGPGERPLQILQLEESDQIHSNVGVAELTGNPVTVTISLYEPDSKITPSVDVPLGANEFKQFNSIVKTLFGESAQTYNARVSVQVTGGNGRVAAYGSAIDQQSGDPTYIPAQ